MTEPLPSLDYCTPILNSVYAGFWKRWLAWLIDWCVLFGLRMAVAALLGGIAALLEVTGLETPTVQAVEGVVVMLVLYLCAWPYYAFMEASRTGGTLGKMAVGLQVIDIDGERPTFAQTTARFFARLASILFLGFGFLMIAFTGRKQALHDMAANCLVVTKGSAPLAPIPFSALVQPADIRA